MNEIKSFTCSILSELSDRMKHRNKKVQIKKELLTLEGLMNFSCYKKDSSCNKKDASYMKNASHNNNSSSNSKNDVSDSKKVITQRDMENMGEIQELKINKGDIVTPLALDLLKKRKIKLIINNQ